MAAPHTKVPSLCTGTAFSSSNLRETHTHAASVHRDSVFRLRHTEHCRFYEQGQLFSLTSLRDTLNSVHIVCTGTAFVFTRLRGCMRVLKRACAVFLQTTGAHT